MTSHIYIHYEWMGPEAISRAHTYEQVEVGGRKGKFVTAAVKQVYEDFQARVHIPVYETSRKFAA